MSRVSIPLYHKYMYIFTLVCNTTLHKSHCLYAMFFLQLICVFKKIKSSVSNEKSW